MLNADAGTLAKHPGMGETSAAALKIVALAACRLARSAVREQPVLGSWRALIDYLTMLSWNALCGIVEVAGSLDKFRDTAHPSPMLPAELPKR